MSEAVNVLGEWDQVENREINVSELDAVVTAYRDQKLKYEAAKKISNDEFAKKEELEGKVIKYLISVNKNSYPVDGVGMATIRSKYVVQTPKTIEDIRLLREFVEKKYGKDVADAKFTMNSASLTKLFNEEMELSNDPSFLLPGVTAPTVMQSLSFTKK